MYSIKNVQYFASREGQGLNASLYKGAVRVAQIHDAGDGGETQYDFGYDVGSRNEEKAFDAFVREWCETSGARQRRDIELAEYLGPDAPKDPELHLYTARGLWLIHAETQMAEAKFLKANSKTTTPFRLKGDAEGEWRMANAVYSPKLRNWLIEKFGDQIERIHDGQPPAADDAPSP